MARRAAQASGAALLDEADLAGAVPQEQAAGQDEAAHPEW